MKSRIRLGISLNMKGNRQNSWHFYTLDKEKLVSRMDLSDVSTEPQTSRENYEMTGGAGLQAEIGSLGRYSLRSQGHYGQRDGDDPKLAEVIAVLDLSTLPS
eukprot:gene13364-28314_t